MNLLWDSHQEDSRHLLYEHSPHLSTMMVVVVVVVVMLMALVRQWLWWWFVVFVVSPKKASFVYWSYNNV